MSYRDLQFDWLQCLVAVVDAGSLSGAAAEVHRSQSAVSMQLKKLEDAVGHRLLERDARKQHLTPEGETLLGYARRILELHAEAHDALNGDALTGRVRLGVPDDYAARYLTPVLKRFAPRHSAVEIELDCEQSTALIPRVANGDLDLALISRDHARRGTLLFHEPMVWVGSAQFELWRRDPLPIAVYESASLARRGAIHALAQQGRRYKVVYHSSSLAGQIAAVEWPGRGRPHPLQRAIAAAGARHRARPGATGPYGGGRVPQPRIARLQGGGQPAEPAGADPAAVGRRPRDRLSA
ncbi:DNA-binding transcriptional LysR family regulator [Acidovorax delafieldii]|uniref:DNA-binding transcriptional LysR family regulator n=1 Tax=Acidovorax delafieldii TaxID=47920 RepID=A0A561XND7_ACIDE|nr:DNA-binding transcriptional LysR family regulator [Acidovorax delafieldii]